MNSFGQQKTLSNSIKKSTTKLEESQKRISLREFVESIYINSLNAFKEEKILMNTDELNVVVKDKSGISKTVKLKDLNSISVDQLQSFEYKKDKIISALYGVNGEKFGKVILELK